MRDQLTRIAKGIFRRADGILMARAKKMDPKTGKPRDYLRAVPRPAEMSDRDYRDVQAPRFLASLRSEFDHLDHAASDDPHRRFYDYAKQQIAYRINTGIVGSRATEKRYASELETHLRARWGDVYLDKIYRADVEKWMSDIGVRVKAGEYSPQTVNGWWRLFKMIMADASVAFRLANPCERIPGISLTLGADEYDPDETNSLEQKEFRPFFESARVVAPRHYAFLLIGTITGRRPCELRPLRARGNPSDLDWETGRLLVRRSQTYGEPSRRLKTRDYVLAWLTPALISILDWHVKHLGGKRAASDLLFPPMRDIEGASGYMARSALAKVIPEICREAKIKKHLTPRFMRRAYQDWCRAGGVDKKIQKAMSGHATDKMLEWYSTMGADEGRTALTKMCAIAGIQ